MFEIMVSTELDQLDTDTDADDTKYCLKQNDSNYNPLVRYQDHTEEGDSQKEDLVETCEPTAYLARSSQKELVRK